MEINAENRELFVSIVDDIIKNNTTAEEIVNQTKLLLQQCDRNIRDNMPDYL